MGLEEADPEDPPPLLNRRNDSFSEPLSGVHLVFTR